MKKLIVFLFPLLLCTSKLCAQNWDKFFETIFPFPILSVSTGKPEFLAADIGVETLFFQIGDDSMESRAGTYFLFSPARSWDTSFFRFSTGLALGMMGLFEYRVGIGYGFMKEQNDFLHTYFYEVAGRLFLLQCKIIFENPIKPDNLVDYYKDRYKPLKIQIGISI